MGFLDGLFGLDPASLRFKRLWLLNKAECLMTFCLFLFLSESQEPNNGRCEDRRREGELESANFRVMGKFSLPEEVVEGTLKKNKKTQPHRDTAIKAMSSFEEANNS